MDIKAIGEKIKQYRKLKGLTQEELAEMVGCNPSHISNIENNYTKASLNTLLAIANSLNTSIDSLLLDQYNNQSLALDNEISNAIAGFDIDMKERVLRIIKAL